MNTSLRNKKGTSGFTIIELIVVVAVIGILAAVTIVGYGAWKKSIATSQVKSDLTNVSAVMESARQFSSSYPSSIPTTFQASSGVTLTLLYVVGDYFCIEGSSTTDPSVEFFIDSLKPKEAQAGTCDTNSTLPYSVTIPSAIQISAITTSTIGLSWGSVTGAVSYQLERSKDTSFIQDVVSVTQSGTTYTAASLNASTSYYFRVRATTSTKTSDWSAVTRETTSAPAPVVPPSPVTASPTIAAGSSNNTYVSASWSAVANATTYIIQKCTTATCTAGGTNVTSGLSYGYSSSAGSKNWFRVAGVNSVGQGPWSSVATATTCSSCSTTQPNNPQ